MDGITFRLALSALVQLEQSQHQSPRLSVLDFGCPLFSEQQKTEKHSFGSVESAGNQTCWYVDICIHIVHNVFHEYPFMYLYSISVYPFHLQMIISL